ncbi:MAG: T9SS type A sorting domain-containing protein [Bacteroidia bacterium]
MKKTIKGKRNLAIFILLLFFFRAQAQVTFQKTFAYTYYSTIVSIVPTTDKGYVLCNYLFNGGNGHYFLTKIDSSFQFQWSQETGNAQSHTPQSIQTCLDGGFIICGSMGDSTGYANMFITKTDSSGNVLWTKNFGGWEHDHGYFVKQTNDGGFIASGKTLLNSSDEAYIVKTDLNGNLLWSTTVSHSAAISGNYAYSIDQTNDNGYIVCGHVTGPGSGVNFDGLLIRMDSTGNVMWTKTYGFTQWDQFRTVYQTSDHGFLIAGTTDTSNDNINSREILLLKTDSAGNVLWAKTFGNSNDNYIFKMIKTLDSNYIMVGYIVASGEDIHLLKADSNGNTIWSRAYGTSSSDEGHAVLSTDDGGYLIGGFGSSKDYLIKTNTDGLSNCNETTPNTLTGNIIYPLLTTTYFQGTNDTNYSETLSNTSYTPVINTLCYSVAIKENLFNDLFSISPNPTTDFLTIHFNLSSPNQTTISLFNIYGQPLTPKGEPLHTNKEELKIDMRNFPAGVYFVKVKTGEKEDVRKVVKY